MSEHKDNIKQVEDIIDKGLNSIEMNFDSNIDATNKQLKQLERNNIKKEDHQDMLFLIKLIFVEIAVTIILLLIYN